MLCVAFSPTFCVSLNVFCFRRTYIHDINMACCSFAELTKNLFWIQKIEYIRHIECKIVFVYGSWLYIQRHPFRILMSLRFSYNAGMKCRKASMRENLLQLVPRFIFVRLAGLRNYAARLATRIYSWTIRCFLSIFVNMECVRYRGYKIHWDWTKWCFDFLLYNCRHCTADFQRNKFCFLHNMKKSFGIVVFLPNFVQASLPIESLISWLLSWPEKGYMQTSSCMVSTICYFRSTITVFQNMLYKSPFWAILSIDVKQQSARIPFSHHPLISLQMTGLAR